MDGVPGGAQGVGEGEEARGLALGVVEEEDVSHACSCARWIPRC